MFYKKISLSAFFILVLIFAPLSIANAAPICEFSYPPTEPQNFKDFTCVIINGISMLVPVIIGLTLIIFLWGLARFIWAGGDEEKIKSGKSLMFWGIVGLFVMVSVWGIINILYGSFFSGGIRLPLLRQ